MELWLLQMLGYDNNMAVAKQKLLIIEYKMAQMNGGINRLHCNYHPVRKIQSD